MAQLLATLARLLQNAARNPHVQAAAAQVARDATARLVRYVRNQTRRRIAGSQYWK